MFILSRAFAKETEGCQMASSVVKVIVSMIYLVYKSNNYLGCNTDGSFYMK